MLSYVYEKNLHGSHLPVLNEKKRDKEMRKCPDGFQSLTGINPTVDDDICRVLSISLLQTTDKIDLL
jgi:hypothetical protein